MRTREREIWACCVKAFLGIAISVANMVCVSNLKKKFVFWWVLSGLLRK